MAFIRESPKTAGGLVRDLDRVFPGEVSRQADE